MSSDPLNANNAGEIDRLALALTKDPGSKAFIPLAEEYAKAGMWHEAAAVLEDGLKAYPNFITAMVALGRAYDQLGQPRKARGILEDAVKMSPDNLRAHRTLAKIYVEQRIKHAGLHSCAVILAANPHDPEALSLKASLERLGIVDEPVTLEPVTPSIGEFDAPRATDRHEPDLSASAFVTNPPTVGDEIPATAVHALDSPSPVDGAQVRRRRLEQWLAVIQSRHSRDPTAGFSVRSPV